MERLIKEEKKSTPMVDFNPETNILKIKGESYPEDAAKFYHPLFDWLKLYLEEVTEPVVAELKVIYLNTSSSKCMMTILDMLEDAFCNGKNITVNWLYNEENEIALECGEEFKEDLEIPFNIIMDNE